MRRSSNVGDMMSIKYPCDTKIGFMEADVGDGLVMERPHKARGTVQKQTSPTLTTGRGGGCGTVTESTVWFNGAKPDGLEEASVGDGVKVYPNPARKGSAGTVQKQSSNTINVHYGGGGGVVEKDLRIRFLTPRECLRLQAFPDPVIDRLMAVLGKSALYKVAGNSIAVCCLKAIFKGIYIDNTFEKADRQLSLNRWVSE